MRKSMNIKKILVVAFLTVAMCFTAVVGVINARLQVKAVDKTSVPICIDDYVANLSSYYRYNVGEDEPAEPVYRDENLKGYVYSFGKGKADGTQNAWGGIHTYNPIDIDSIDENTIIFGLSYEGVFNHATGDILSECLNQALRIKFIDENGKYVSVLYDGTSVKASTTSDAINRGIADYSAVSLSTLKHLTGKTNALITDRGLGFRYDKANQLLYIKRFVKDDNCYTDGVQGVGDAVVENVELSGKVTISVASSGVTGGSITWTNPDKTTYKTVGDSAGNPYRQNLYSYGEEKGVHPSVKYTLHTFNGVSLSKANAVQTSEIRVTRKEVEDSLVYTPSIENGEAGDAVYYSEGKKGLVLSMGKSNGIGKSTGGSYTFKNIPTDYLELKKYTKDNVLANQGVPLIAFEYIGAYKHKGGITNDAPNGYSITLSDSNGNRVNISVGSNGENISTTVTGISEPIESAFSGNSLFGRWFGKGYGEIDSQESPSKDGERRYVRVFYDKNTHDIYLGRGYDKTNGGADLDMINVYQNSSQKIDFQGPISIELSTIGTTDGVASNLQSKDASFKFLVQAVGGYTLSEESKIYPVYNVAENENVICVKGCNDIDLKEYVPLYAFNKPLKNLYGLQATVNGETYLLSENSKVTLPNGEYDIEYSIKDGETFAVKSQINVTEVIKHNVNDISYIIDDGSTLQYEENVSIGTSGQTVSGLTLKTPAISSTSNGGGYATINNVALNGEDTVLFKGVFAPQYLKTNDNYQKEFNSFHIRMYDSASDNFVTLQLYGSNVFIGLNKNDVIDLASKQLVIPADGSSTLPLIVSYSFTNETVSVSYGVNTVYFTHAEISPNFTGFTENINLQFGFNGIPVAIRGYYVKVSGHEEYYKGSDGAVVKDTAVNNGTKIVITELGGYDMTTGSFNYPTESLSSTLKVTDLNCKVGEEIDFLNNLGYTSQFGAVLNTVDSGNVIIEDRDGDPVDEVEVVNGEALYTFAHAGEYTYYIKGNVSVRTTVAVKYEGNLSSDGLFEVIGSGASAEKGTAILYNQGDSDYGANGYSGEVSKLDTRTTSGIVLKGGSGSSFTFTNKINLKDSFAEGLDDYESVDQTIGNYNSFIGLEVAPNPVFEVLKYSNDGGKTYNDYNELTHGLKSFTITLTDAYNSNRKVNIIISSATVHEDRYGINGTNGYIGVSAEDENDIIPQGVERIGEKKIYGSTVFSVGMTGSNPRPFELTYDNGVIATPNGSKSSYVGNRIRNLKYDYTGWGDIANLDKTFAGFTADEVYVTITFGQLNKGHESTQIVLTKLGDLDFTKSTYSIGERVLVDETKADNVSGELKFSDNLTVYNTFTGNVKPCDEYALKGVTAKVWFGSSVEEESVEVGTDTTYTFNKYGKYKIEYFKGEENLGYLTYNVCYSVTLHDGESSLTFDSVADFANELGYTSSGNKVLVGFGINSIDGDADFSGNRFIFLDEAIPDDISSIDLTVCYLRVKRDTYINLSTNISSGTDNFAGLAFTTFMNKYDLDILTGYGVNCDNRMGTISGYSRSVKDTVYAEPIELGANVSYAETLENCKTKKLTNGDDIAFVCVLPCESAYRYEYKYVFQFISGIKFVCGKSESLVPFFNKPITACLEELANEKLGTAENLGEVFSTENSNGYTKSITIKDKVYYTTLDKLKLEILLDFAGYEDLDAFIGDKKIQGMSYDVNSLDDSTINFYGRNYEDSNGDVVFSYGASGFEVAFYGTELKANMYGICNGNYKPYMQVLVDGEKVPTDDANAKKFQLTSSTEIEVVTLVSGLDEGYHTVKVLKRSAYARGETVMDQAVLCSISTDGYILTPPSKPSLKIDVYGDSISCGYGNLDGQNMNSVNTNALLTYAYQTAQDLSAQISIQAHSGWGVRYGTGKTQYYWYDKYDLLRYGDNTKYDFEYQPDIIVINLGTNDASAKDLPEFTTEFTEKYIMMINGLKAKCPNAEILLVYGMMGINSKVSGAIESVAEACNVNYYFFTNHAASGHPIASEHIACATELTTQIKSILQIA